MNLGPGDLKYQKDDSDNDNKLSRRSCYKEPKRNHKNILRTSKGLGDTLADAIGGLKEGNAPGFHFYKRAAIWKESAKIYLRS
ncbi:unnamed protein product [Penicillium camemberti]|uniref:Str. FM013 n=1 Tax=Penicillium camemberti (strain FM 013) TaxID=1429867 RepID=A0A0G4PY06_PENC3|nr:unnamed protein product [Penicillium camemberti]